VHPVSRAVIDRTPDRLKPSVRLAVRTVDASIADRLPGLAAELAFWVVLSLPALLLTLVATVGAVSALVAGDWQDELLVRTGEAASVVLTPATIERFLLPLMRQLLDGDGFGVVSFAFLATVWTASRAMKVILVALALIYDRHDHRPTWQARILAFAMAFGGLVVGTLLAPLLLSGPNVIAMVDDWIAVIDLSVLATIWAAAYWPTVVLVATLAIALLYHLGVPGPRLRWRDELPGAALATAVWLAGSAGLRFYGVWILGTTSVYGPLSGPIVALLWIWLTGFAVLLGAEFNAQRRIVSVGVELEESDRVWPLTARPET
jgi:membrane protein